MRHNAFGPDGAAPPVLTGGSGPVKERATYLVAGQRVTVLPIQAGNGMSLPAAAGEPVTITVQTLASRRSPYSALAEVDVTEGRKEVPGTFKLFVIPCGKTRRRRTWSCQRGRVYKIVTQKHTLWLNIANN